MYVSIRFDPQIGQCLGLDLLTIGEERRREFYHKPVIMSP